MALRYIWFDQDDTLYDYSSAMHRAMRPVLALIEREYPHVAAQYTAKSLSAKRRRICDALDAEGMDFARARDLAFEMILRDAGVHDEALPEVLTETYYAQLRREIAPFARTKRCLRELGAQFTLGVLSNGRSLLPHLGLEESFEHRLYTAEIGLRKPDPEFFKHAMERVGAAPEECLMVGDNPEHDVIGALEVGWHAVWLRCEHRPWPEGAPRHPHAIDCIGDLPEAVRTIIRAA